MLQRAVTCLLYISLVHLTPYYCRLCNVGVIVVSNMREYRSSDCTRVM